MRKITVHRTHWNLSSSAADSDHQDGCDNDRAPQHCPQASEPRTKPGKVRCEDCWKCSAFTPDLVQSEAQDER